MGKPDDDRPPADEAAKPDPAEATARPFNTEDMFNLGELFGEFFGGTKPVGPKRGADLRVDLTIPYRDAVNGCTFEVKYARSLWCTRCDGTGAEYGVLQPCAGCRTTGKQHAKQGEFFITTICEVCKGRGRCPDVECDSCTDGVCNVTATKLVTIPAGIETGQTLRQNGEGGTVHGGEAGDLYIVVTVDTTNVLVPRGDDVVLEIKVTARHLLFGGTLEVATPEGPTKITVPRGVRDGDTVRLPGRGAIRASAPTSGDPYRDVARGDQIVVFRVPENVTREKVKYILGGVLVAVVAALGVGIAL